MRAVCSAVLTIGLLFIPSVLGHAGITSPPIRQPGKAFLDKCGQPSFNSVKGDATGHIEEQEPVKAGCELTLCRGMLFEDQPAANVQRVSPGDSMTMGVDCTIPHGGPANVSLIDTTGGGSGTVIGSFLKTFDDFCPTSGKTPADQAKTQFTLPSANVVGDKCQKAGDCVVQLFWATPDFSQNYYYCVDVAMATAASPPSTPVKPTSISAVRSTSQVTSVVRVTSTLSSSSEAARETVTSSSIEVSSTSVESTSSIIETLSSNVSTSSAVIPTSVSSAASVSSADEATSATSVSALNDQSAPNSASAVQPSKFTTVVVVTNTNTASPTAAASLKQTSSARRTKRILWFYI